MDTQAIANAIYELGFDMVIMLSVMAFCIAVLIIAVSVVGRAIVVALEQRNEKERKP